MIEWKDFEHKVAEFFRRYGYTVKLNEKVVGSSGAPYEIDVLVLDRNFKEIKIACQCKAHKNPVDRDQILLWTKTCEDIHATPAFASTSGYTEPAVKIAVKSNFILLGYDEKTNTVYKVGAKEKVLLPLSEEETGKLIFQAKQLIQKVDERVKQLMQLYKEEGIKDEEERKRLKAEAESTFKQVISLYSKALERQGNKYEWLELGRLLDPEYSVFLYNLVDELSEKAEVYSQQVTLCYLKALREHLKEFPDVLKELGSKKYLALPSRVREPESNLCDALITDISVENFQIYLLRTYLEARPDDAEAWLKLADHYTEIGEIDEAEQACKRALEIDPNNTKIITLSYFIYRRIAEKIPDERRFLNKAIELLKRMCELEPDRAWAYEELADIYSTFVVEEDREKDIDKAIHYMEEALKRYKKPLWYSWKKLGDLYLEKGDKEKAFECYSKAIELKQQQ